MITAQEANKLAVSCNPGVEKYANRIEEIIKYKCECGYFDASFPIDQSECSELLLNGVIAELKRNGYQVAYVESHAHPPYTSKDVYVLKISW